jgi:hypothetical protein
MTDLKRLWTALALAIVISAPVFAGEMQTGITEPPPPPVQQTSTAETGTEVTATSISEISNYLESLPMVSLKLLQSLLSIF